MVERILIDAVHPEEIRLVLTENDEVKSFDYQNKEKASIRGNVYLAKVTRVETSLQAAFVDYGGNKHGFLPLSEIHPDYYQIPKDDKDSLLKIMMEAKQDEQEMEDDEQKKDSSYDEENLNKPTFYKKYKIQEVIRRDQLLLVQVIKEERGTKGASLSTYISLAGRYCVLLPNANNAGGVSRKIDDAEERSRLKSVIKELGESLEPSHSVIMRTAGAYKTKAEIKRDLSYLSRLWSNIRGHTISSIAPTFIHEEGDIIKKAIRDLYSSDVEEIVVAGEGAYENAKAFMKLVLPRHIDKVKMHQELMPILSKYSVEEQLSMLYSNVVQLKSGGYIVINQTEALVAIDVNSGRSNSEKSIEGTALKNNLEAARETARQIRLRDLSGLIVIDFIDMEESKNRKEVEKVLKDSLTGDKAKIQVGRISEFGLLELSRQRLRSSFLENSMLSCSHCAGRGKIRPVDVTATAIIRAIETDIASELYCELKVSCSKEILIYMLNHKSTSLAEIEKKHDIRISFTIDEEAGADSFFLDGIKSNIPTKKSALSAIDFEPYVVEKEIAENKIDHQDDESVDEVPKKKVNKKKTTKPQYNNGVNDKAEAPIQEMTQQQKTSRHRRRFRQQHDNQNHGFSSADGLNMQDDASKKIKQAEGKNHSLLREIWKKIVD